MTDHYLTVNTVTTRWQRFAVRALAAFGWRVNVAPLPGPRGVVIVYPHTSNWDFLVGLFAKWAIGVRFRWLGKEALFRGLSGLLLGPLLRAWGGEPVERREATGAIARLAARINASGHFWLALAPEGTRKYRHRWRSGFYHIARSAGVPLGVATIDYATREVRMLTYLSMEGDPAADLARIRAAYRDCRGLHPQCASPIDFAFDPPVASPPAVAQVEA
ncbi:MAG TPA: 1-acyl-sn-glycerol-3-phosphate acyltransferase [Noviherbaspirillum sp.]|jgi:1-acyl-sn-glycerol-3-phosphate acyltransferase|uniref:1-acyl-sn-glycerol-3-phosphate acyltransferase n=1 Tax=Noviherbaspirillum sp. TaxID=1926288 RepID=UPI002F9508D8